MSNVNHEANEYARLFSRLATMRGYDLPMSLLAELIALFEVALSQSVGKPPSVGAVDPTAANQQLTSTREKD